MSTRALQTCPAKCRALFQLYSEQQLFCETPSHPFLPAFCCCCRYSSPANMRYISWAAAMCENASRAAVPCTMCNNTGSPALPNYNNTIFTCNAGCNSPMAGGANEETWIDGHRRAYPNQPGVYTAHSQQRRRKRHASDSCAATWAVHVYAHR